MRKESWRKNAVVLTVLVLVGAAVVINWKFSPPAEDVSGAVSGEESGQKLLGQSTLVSGEEDSSAPEGEDAVYTGTDYFASARLTRQQARDSAIELLRQAAAEEGAAESAATEASEGIQALAAYTLAEAQIENLVTAKGYADCVAFMGEDSISVVVSTGTGELHLMLTLESDGQRTLAESAEESVSGGEEVVVTRRESPVYRGALVVCQGADRAEVKLAVTRAVAALTGLGADRITVVKCQ